MEDVSVPFTLIDALIALGLIGSILGACHRGIGREMLHTVLFAILVAAGYVLFRNQAVAPDKSDVAFWVVNSTYYLMTAYVLTWVGMRILSPLMLAHEKVGLRSRFWAGTLSIVKLATVIIGLNLWFAMHSPDAHPLRLASLPKVMQESLFVRVSDMWTERLYQWLASQQIVDYNKTVERARDAQKEAEQRRLDELRGVSTTTE